MQFRILAEMVTSACAIYYMYCSMDNLPNTTMFTRAGCVTTDTALLPAVSTSWTPIACKL